MHKDTSTFLSLAHTLGKETCHSLRAEIQQVVPQLSKQSF